MTNQEYLIAALNDEIDDGGASWEAKEQTWDGGLYRRMTCERTEVAENG